MIYYELIVLTEKESVETISELLEQEGKALSITWQDAGFQEIFEPELETTPLWSQVQIKAIFDTHSKAEAAKILLQHQQNAVMEIVPLHDTNWSTAWHRYFKPIAITPSFWIVPTGLQPPNLPEAKWIYLSPGLAFGTGTHPTTQLCLKWLAEQDLNSKTVIDYGCGSGILALAALRLGAQHVYAIDIDKQALEATKNNLQENGFSPDLVTTLLPNQFPSHIKADVLIANILLLPLIELQKTFVSHLNPKGLIALSGIMNDQWETLHENYCPSFVGSYRQDQENWSLWAGQQA